MSCGCGVRFVDRLAQIEHMIAARRGVDAAGVPRVTIADALELLESWTVAVRDAIGDQVSIDQVAPYWSELADRLVGAARRRASGDAYPDRADLFGGLRQLARLADQLVAIRIADAFGAGWRNATVIPSGDDGLDVTDVKDWIDLLDAIARHLREKRGTVKDASSPPGRAREYPQTTVGEVLAMAEFWTERLGELERRAVDGIRDAVTAWRRVVGETLATVRGLDPTATYPKDAEFWGALLTFVAAIDKARGAAVKPTWHVRLGLSPTVSPPTGDVVSRVKDAAHAIVQGAQNVAGAAVRGVQGAAASAAVSGLASTETGGIDDTVRGLARDAGREAAHAAADQAKLELRKLARPVAIGGAVVLGALILIPALTRR